MDTPTNLSRIEDLIEEFCQDDWKFLIREKSVVQSYKAKSYIFKEGEKMECISIVKKGNVKVFSTYAKNEERIYRFATDGQVLGHRGLGDSYLFSVSALALTDTEVTKIPLSLFQSLLKANSLFCYYFMMFLAEELRHSEEHMKHLSTMNLRQRVASALKLNADTFGFDSNDPKKLKYTIARKDIASLAGTTYESVIRTLSDFEKEKLIEILGKQTRILDYKKLDALL